MATIKLDLDRIHGAIDKRMFGFFTEHLSRIIYKGIFEPGSPLSDSDGFRKDVIKALEAFSPSMLRWPGGNFASGYDWKKGIGTTRKPVYDPVWRVVEPNTFGTDEFVKYCRKIGSEPYICVNAGDGEQREAMQWVEYCNGKAGTEIADLRVKNGYIEPYGVKTWGLGNELCGDWQLGNKSAENYAAIALEYAKAMRLVDPTIELVAAGGIHMWDFEQVERNWDRIILERLVGIIDYVGLHFYARKMPGLPDKDASYRQHMAEPEWLDKNINMLRGEIFKAEYHMSGKEPRGIKIAADELGVCFETETHSDLQDALVSACLINTLLNNTDIVAFCSYTSIANVFSPIFTSEDGLLLQTVYYPLELFARLASGYALDLYVESPRFDSNVLKGLPLLHASAAHDPDMGSVSLFVVNRDPKNDIETEIIMQGEYKDASYVVHEVNGSALDVRNTFENSLNVCTVVRTENSGWNNGRLNYVFPAHSFTVITFSTCGNV